MSHLVPMFVLVSLGALLGLGWLPPRLRHHGPNQSARTTTRRLAATAIVVGVAGMIGCGLVGFLASIQSRHSVADLLARQNLATAHTIDDLVLAHAGTIEPEALDVGNVIGGIWRMITPPHPQSYACVIGSDGHLAHHTLKPELAGLDLRGVAIAPDTPGGSRTVGELLARHEDWAGVNLNARGQRQLVGYAYSDLADGLIVVHTPASAIEDAVAAAALPWGVGLLIVALLIPAALGLLYRSFAAAERSRTAAVDALRGSEERLELALLGTDQGIWDWDLQAGTVYVSDTAAAMLGYERDETEADLAGWERLVHPDDLPHASAALRAHLDGRTPTYTAEYRMRGQSGLWKWMLHRGRVTARDAAGRPLRMAGTRKDIDARKRAEQALRRSESWLRSITENAPDLIARIDRSGTVIYANRELPGAREQSAATIFDWVPESHHASVSAALERVFDGEAPAYEAPVRGEPDRWYDYRLGPLAVGGTVNGAVLIAQDVTERRRAVARMRQTQERLLRLAEASPSIVFRSDPEGRAVYVNERWRALTGLPEGAWQGDGWAEAVHEDDRHDTAASWRAAVAGRTEWRHEFRFRHADGGVVWVLGLAVPVLRDDGTVDGFIGTCTDITELKRTEAALRGSEQRFRQLAENMDDVFWLTEWNEQRLLYVSPAYERVWGCTVASLYADNDAWSRAVHPDDRARVEHAFRRNAPRGTYDEEYRLVMPDGTLRWIHDRAFPIRDAQGRVYRVAGVSKDITDRKRNEDELRRRSKTERLLFRELDHRVRNNLSALVALVDMTRDRARDKDDFATAIAGRIQTMAIVHASLSGSRWSSARLHDLVRSLVPPEARSAVHLEGPDLEVSGPNATSLAMVIHEMVTNSVKHGALRSDRGRITVQFAAADAAASSVSIRWSERNGPIVEPKPAPGLGTALIEGLVRNDLRGEVAFGFMAEGVDHRLTLHLDGPEIPFEPSPRR